jgi:threonine aldolase
LSELAETVHSEVKADRYGGGPLLEEFEQEIAQLLGKEAAVFMPSGTMCQQIALRIWCERRGKQRIAYHPTCHLEIHEHDSYQRVHRLERVLLGSMERMFTLDDLKAVAEPLGALLIELPQREIGGQLPSWEELTEVTTWAREREIATHLDGARLWECKPFYGREYREIAALFDTVYVSFYKILDGIAGAVLAGPADIIAEARVWQRRQGGNLISLYPYVLAAQKGMQEHLGRIEMYCAKARDIAAALDTLPQIEIMPNPPQTNMMHLFMRGEREKLQEAALHVAEETQTWLFGNLAPSQIPAYSKTELSIGEAALDIPTAEIAELFACVFQKLEVS